ncbi:hypothetical protein DB88DRAFT_492235 [Papiliotrema laurentii]|uniref:SAGA-associated factor 11 n=1 Tax=Papiliotrema laurentii TaxID=5418 RepID=A0AAD9CX72_PAPLA|nr:hypothetical protein DB88DRAFT_492235 [Papiliotrema laurentii]
MPDRSAEIKAAVRSIYDDMLANFVLDVAIATHRDYKRSRTVCGTCGTNCRSHLPIPPPPFSLHPAAAVRGDSSSAAPSRTASPQPQAQSSQEGRAGGYTAGPEKGTGGSTGIGSGSGRVDSSGNAFFDCLVCGRAIASTRYAPHLSSCLGLNGSTRRGAARSAAAKARLGANDRSSPSPYLQSENGDSDADSSSGKKSKKTSNANGKRGRSPSKPPSVLGKKSKFSSGTATPTPSIGRPALPPSKLGRPPKNRSPAQPPSPISVSSPDYSIVSSQDTGGMIGRKTLPTSMYDQPIIVDDQDAPGEEYVPGDESSEGPDDY